MPFSSETIRALEPVLEAARAELSEMDQAEIPRGLSKVAQKTGGRLPPPLARSLLEALEDEWFRDRVAKRLDDDATPVSLAFLRREDGWWQVVANRIAEIHGASSAAEIASLQNELSEANSFAEEAERRTRAAQEAADSAELEAQRRATESARRTEERIGSEREELARLRAEVEALRTAEAELMEDRAELAAQLAGLRKRLGGAKRQENSPPSAPAGLPVDPVAAARELDMQRAILERRVALAEPSPPTRSDRESHVELPPGVPPDRPDALEWVLARPTPVTVIVDGYNVAHRLDPATATLGVTRRRINQGLQRLRRQSAASHRMIVVYDSAMAGSRGDAEGPAGVEVRFAEAGRLADDEVIDLAGSLSGPVVVVSSDREVREGSVGHGAIGLWAEALVPLL